MIVVFAILSGTGLLAMSIGAFGVLDAYHERNSQSRHVDWLIALYVIGILANIGAYTMLHRWYVAVPLTLMLLPAERAFDKRGTFRRRSREVKAIVDQS